MEEIRESNSNQAISAMFANFGRAVGSRPTSGSDESGASKCSEFMIADKNDIMSMKTAVPMGQA